MSLQTGLRRSHTPQERLRQMRIQEHMTLKELGRRLGRSKQYMSELERGNIRLTYEMAVSIAEIFHTTPDAIFLSDADGPDALQLEHVRVKSHVG